MSGRSIVLVTPGYPPMRGGIETHVHRLTTGLAAAGDDVEVWTHGRDVLRSGAMPPEPPEPPEPPANDGVRVRWFDTTRSHRFPVSAAMFRAARRDLARRRPDVLHVHAYHAIPAVTSLLAPRDVPVVFTPHFHGGGHTALARLAHVPYSALGRRVVTRADRLVAVSRSEADLLTARFPDVAPKLSVIRNGVDVADLGRAVPFDLDRPVVLVCGRHEAYKRIDLVVEAFDRLSAPARLVITGSGPDTERITAAVRASRRSTDIELAGHVPTDDLRRWQRSAHAVVNMSTDEAFGIAAVEAVAAGATAVLSDIPVHRESRELLPEGSVRVVGAGDPRDELGQLLDAVVAAPRRAPVDVWSWDDAVAAHLRLYAELTGIGPSSS